MIRALNSVELMKCLAPEFHLKPYRELLLIFEDLEETFLQYFMFRKQFLELF